MDRDKFLLVIIVAVFIYLVQSRQMQPEQHGYLESSFNDVMSNKSAITSFNELSKIKCAAECSKRSECYSFFYSKTTNQCQLHSTVLFWYTSGAVAFPGFRYYRMPKQRDSSGGCPSWAISKNYTYNSTVDVCYFLYTNALIWNEAWEVCANDGGHLITYTDQATHNWLVELVNETGSVLIDGYDENNDDNFKNYKNDLVTGSFWHQDPVQPNNWRDMEDCIILAKLYQYNWGDVMCDRAFPFVCQIDHS